MREFALTTSETQPTTRRLRIWDHPESRITFLETILKDKDWEAIIYEAPKSAGTPEDPTKSLEEIQKELCKKGYKTEIGVDDEGTRALSIKHFGTERGLVTNVQEFGLSKGCARTIDTLPDTLSHTVTQIKDGLSYATGDKARLLSSFYILGDILQTFSGLANKKEDGYVAPTSFSEKIKEKYNDIRKPANALQSGVGLAALAQSLIYMKFAKDGSEMHLNRLSSLMENALENGVEPSDVLKYSDKNDERKSHNPLTAAKNFLERHPIETGATIQMTGGLMNISSYLIKQKKEFLNNPEALKGSYYAIAGSMASIAGWIMLMYKGEEKPKDADGKPLDGKEPNLFQRHPEAFASATEIGANALQMIGGGLVKNPLVVASQASFMVGDATMFFMKNNDYGAAGVAKVDMTAKAAARFISIMPMVLGQEEEQKFIGDLSRYLARQIVEDKMKLSKGSGALLHTDLHEEELVKDITGGIAKAIRKELSGKERKLTAIVNEAANIAHAFPEDEQPKIIDKLADTINNMAGVYINRDSLRALIDAEERTLVMLDSGDPNKPIPRPKMQELAPHISTIVLALPPVNATENATLLYDMLAPEMQTSKNDGIFMQQALKQNAGVPAHVAALQTTSPQHDATQIAR
jgi:hypothetical protein